MIGVVSLVDVFEEGDGGEGRGIEESRGFEGGFEESANSRVCERTLHCRHIDDALPKDDDDGRVGIRNDRKGCDSGIESEKSLGTKRDSGCIAALLLRMCRRRHGIL